MNYCNDIKAYFRREERYEGLQLVYGVKSELKDVILNVVEETKKETGLIPMIFGNISKDHPEKEAIYLEFNDSYDREGDEFFETVLKKLGIEKCS
ncbi:MAG: hypothetical protein QG567_1626 [Campylobacterota bacterium]|nr:hypothetical protein [Campylobacterota bacterium]